MARRAPRPRSWVASLHLPVNNKLITAALAIALAPGAIAALLLYAGPISSSLDSSPRAQYSVARNQTADFLIGTVTGYQIEARMGPDLATPLIGRFSGTNDFGSPRVFLLQPDSVAETGYLPEDASWVRALLPIEPNGTLGYLPVEDLEITTTAYRIIIDRSAFELTLLKGSEIVFQAPVGIGDGLTPTPGGRFYLTALLEPPDPDTVYGQWAYGTSGFSEALDTGPFSGVIGIHGTNDPSSVGHGVSHGCIRMRNEDIGYLVPLLPLGTPVDIL